MSKHGLRGSFQGFGPTLGREIPSSALYFGSYGKIIQTEIYENRSSKTNA